MTKHHIAGLVAAFMLTACASSGTTINAQSQVKRAWVVGYVVTDVPREHLPVCLATLPEEELRSRRFVKLHYRHVRKMIDEVAEIPAGLDLAIDDRIEVEAHDCDRGRLTVIKRKLPPV